MNSRAKVLLLNPPFFPNYSRSQRSPAVIKSGTLYYPIWLAYATGALQKAGHDCLLIDAPASQIELPEVLDRAEGFSPDLVILDTSTPSILNDLAVLREVRGRIPSARYILVGNHASATAPQLLAENPEVDGVCLREYDETVVDLADRMAAGERDIEIPGLQRKAEETPRYRDYIRSLDDLPWAASVYKQFLPIRRYFYSITQYPVLTIITGRGCPYKCTYCVYPQVMHGHKYRVRSVEDVVAELEYVERELPFVKEIFFEDDTLTVHPKRMRAMCEEILRKGVKISWTANSRCDVDLETLRIMRKANCRLLCVGVESGDQQILDNIQKRIRLDQIEQFAEDTRKAGVMVHGCFMVGNRGETHASLEKTFNLAVKLNFDTAQFFPLMVYPGTSDYKWAEENGLIRAQSYQDWVDEEGCHNCVVEREDLPSAELVKFCDQARRRYYLRPRYMYAKAKQVIRHPREFKRVAKAGKTLAKYLVQRG